MCAFGIFRLDGVWHYSGLHAFMLWDVDDSQLH
jgi:hypothetical protein